MNKEKSTEYGLTYPSRWIYNCMANQYLITNIMPRWKKGEKEFRVSIMYHEHRGCQTYPPRLVVEVLGNPKTIRFIVNNKRREAESGH
jgi:hypothetical protein